MRRHPPHGIAAQIEQKLGTLLRKNAPSVLANPQNCENIDFWSLNKAISIADNYTALFYQVCGQMYTVRSDHALALKMYGGFLKRYPQHQLAEKIKVEWGKSKIAWAKTVQYKNIGKPVRVGFNSNGTTSIRLQNDSPNKIRLIASGSETLITEIPPCQKCTSYLENPNKCPKPEDEPFREYKLAPGKYNILIEFRSDRGYRNLFLGGGAMETSTKYDLGCYFTIKRLEAEVQPQPEVEGADEWLAQ